VRFKVSPPLGGFLLELAYCDNLKLVYLGKKVNASPRSPRLHPSPNLGRGRRGAEREDRGKNYELEATTFRTAENSLRL
jgi:hypothetical protein